MARSKRKKSKPASKPAKASTQAPTNDAGAQDYWLEKATRFVDKGRLDDAIAVLDRFWPRPADRLHPDRLRWLLTHAPAAALDEIRALPPDVRADAATLTALADALLLLGDDADALLALEGLPADWVERARHLRAASAHLAAGDDAAATAALRAVGRAPAFAGPQRFLRGLGAWYARADDQAALLWAPLRDAQPFGPVVARLLEGPPPSGTDDLTALHGVVAALRACKPNKALSAAAAAFDALAPTTKLLLARDLPGALAALGVPPLAAVERVRRALPGQDERIDPLALTALAAEIDQDAPMAVEHWRHLARRLPPSDRAAALHRSGGLLARGATACEADATKYWWERAEHRATAAALRRQALADLRAAAEADPDEPAWWPALIDAASRTGRSERTQALETYVARFPDAPDALLRAAEACADRGSWDKGLRYARRAAELHPLDRRINELQVQLLTGKARKKAKAGDRATAAALYAEARAVPHLTPDAALELAAEVAAFELYDHQPAAADALRDAILATDPRPWLWVAQLDLAFLRLAKKGPRHVRLPPGAERHFQATVPPPSVADLEALLELWQAHSGDASMAYALDLVINRAVTLGVPPLSSLRLVQRALDAVSDPQARLQLALQGQALDPADLEFTIARYEAALELRLPPDAFKTALDELRRHRVEHSEVHRDAPWMAAVCPVEDALDELLEDIGTHLRRCLQAMLDSDAEPPQPPHTPTRKRAPRPPEAEQQTLPFFDDLDD